MWASKQTSLGYDDTSANLVKKVSGEVFPILKHFHYLFSKGSLTR